MQMMPIMNCVSDEFDQACLQSDLDTLTNWSSEWQLTFNVSKCKQMHSGRSNINCPYTMEGHFGEMYTLKQTQEEKDLGIWLDRSLKFSSPTAIRCQ